MLDYLVITAAGQGSRFELEGYALPKPLILFKQKPLFYWAVESALNSLGFKNILFVVQKKHEREFGISGIIKKYYPKADVKIIDRLTRGAAETAYLATEHLQSDCSVAFLDCDLFFSLPKIKSQDLWRNSENVAALCTFDSQSPNYSYVEIKDEKIVAVREKAVVSNDAVGGFYLFRSVGFFKKTYLSYIKTSSASEFYMSGLFNLIAATGNCILQIKLDKHVSLGTPRELDSAEAFIE